MAHIVIVGAGVIGLQTGITLKEAGFEVVIIAEHLPGDSSIEYTSPWAGAIWRTHSLSHQVEQCQWDLESYRAWMDLTKKDPEMGRRRGLERRPIYVYSTISGVDTSSPSLWYSPHVENFAILPISELPPGCKSGVTYESIALNPNLYLKYLFTQVVKLGIPIIHRRVPTDEGLAKAVSTAVAIAEEISSNVAAVINCTGLSAKRFCQDDNMYPIRGQTLLVRISPVPPDSERRIIMHEDPKAAPAVTYIVPRPGTDTFVFGGTKKADDWNTEPDLETTEGILSRCKNAWSALRDVDIVIDSEQVGLRPGRKGGIRIEEEQVEIEDGRKMHVVHQYGHSGAGYQLSIGSATKVLAILKGI